MISKTLEKNVEKKKKTLKKKNSLEKPKKLLVKNQHF